MRWHREQQRADAAAWTIRARWTAIRGMLVYATRHRLIPTNPADLLTRRERPSPGESRVRFLNEQEMRALLAAAPPRFRAAVATMLFTGLRASEALGLVWADIDFTKRRVLVRHQMGRRGQRARLKSKGAMREVILIPRLAAILEEHRRASRWSTPDDLVFTSTVGTSMTYRRLSQAMKKATTDAGLRGVSAHVLRHTFASILIYQGRDVAFVARQLGHTTPSTSARLAVVEAVVDELAAFYPPHRVHDWIYAPHRLLGDAKPAERIQAGRGDEVLAIIAELRDGAFG